MRRTRTASLVLLAAMFVLAPAAGSAADTRLKIAVLAVQAGEGFSEKEVRTIEELVVSALATDGRLRVIGPGDIAALVGFEQQKQLLGCAGESTCVAEIAGALGVGHLAATAVGKLGSVTVLTVKIIDVKTATVVARGRRTTSRAEDLVQMVDEAVVLAIAGLSLPSRATGKQFVAPTSPVLTTAAALAPAVPPPAPARPLPPAVVASAAVPDPLEEPWSGGRIAGVVGLVVGGVLLATAAGLGLAVRRDAESLGSVPREGAQAAELIRSINAQALRANWLAVGGGVVAAGGVGVTVAF